MVSLIQKTDLNPNSFSNNNTLASGGIQVRTNAGSTVNNAITAAIAAIPDAADLSRGLVQLAVNANYPQNTNDVDAVTPAYLKTAIDAIVVPSWTTLAEGLVEKASTTEVAQVRGRGVNNTFTTAPVLLLDDVRGVTADNAADIARNETLISANLTLTVGTANWPTFADAWNWLLARRIAFGANVTINLPDGNHDFPANNGHLDSANILIRAATAPVALPVVADFVSTDSTPAARSADYAANLAMLRIKFPCRLISAAPMFWTGRGGRGRFQNLLVEGAVRNYSKTSGASGGSNFSSCAIAAETDQPLINFGDITATNGLYVITSTGTTGITTQRGTLFVADTFVVVGGSTNALFCGFGSVTELQNTNALFASSLYGIQLREGGSFLIDGTVAIRQCSLNSILIDSGNMVMIDQAIMNISNAPVIATSIAMRVLNAGVFTTRSVTVPAVFNSPTTRNRHIVLEDSSSVTFDVVNIGPATTRTVDVNAQSNLMYRTGASCVFGASPIQQFAGDQSKILLNGLVPASASPVVGVQGNNFSIIS